MKSAISSAGQSVGLRKGSSLRTSARKVDGNKCPLCGLGVLWALAEGVRRVALVPRPAPMGEFLLLPTPKDGVPVVHRLGKTETFPVASLFYAGHAAKCRGGR